MRSEDTAKVRTEPERAFLVYCAECRCHYLSLSKFMCDHKAKQSTLDPKTFKPNRTYVPAAETVEY